MRVIIYTKSGCPFCSLLKLELGKRGIPYESFDLTDDDDRSQFYRNSGKLTVPQLYITRDDASLTNPSGVSLGGYSDISKDWTVLTDKIK